MANITTPVFTASTPEIFASFPDSRRFDPALKGPDPAKMKAFNESKGQKQFAKRVFEPANGVKGLNDEELKAKPDAFAFDEPRKRVASAPVAPYVISLGRRLGESAATKQ
ncbi:MAG: hypothetical protein H7Z15_23260 [Rhizobacter sp.]|nr:hypothetical protein [Rhizobacter sp.]